MRHRSVFSFFANPYVVLADVMVSLVFIIALFLLSTTVYSEQMKRIAERNARREAMAQTLEKDLKEERVLDQSARRIVLSQNKYRLTDKNGVLLEVEDDGTLQRFRFFRDIMAFEPGATDLKKRAASLDVLRAFGRVLVEKRGQIKSIVIEGYAMPDEQKPWPLSLSRAENVRSELSRMQIFQDVRADYKAPVFQFMSKRASNGQKLWDSSRFNEWHLQEHAARRLSQFNKGHGVLPMAWVIVSGRGDSLQRGLTIEDRGPVVEFKLEYTERSGPPLDDYLNSLPETTRRQAMEAGILPTK